MAVAQALAQVTTPDNRAVLSLCQEAFRYARMQGRESAWAHIGTFAPVLAALGGSVITEAWRRIQAVERLVGGMNVNPSQVLNPWGVGTQHREARRWTSARWFPLRWPCWHLS